MNYELTEQDLVEVGNNIKKIASDYSSRFSFFSFEDLVQDAWVLFYKYFETYYDQSRGAKVSTWFYTVLRNEMLNRLQNEMKQSALLISIDDEDTGLKEQIESKNLSTASEVSGYYDLLDVLEQALSPYARRLLLLFSRYGNTISQKTQAEELQLSLKDLAYVREELKRTTEIFA